MTEAERRKLTMLCEPQITRLNPREEEKATAQAAMARIEELEHQCQLLTIAARARAKDIAAAKAIARKHDFQAGDYECAEGLVRNILAVLTAERDLHNRKNL